MKNTILHWTSVLLASSALMLSACSSSDEDAPETTTPVFPEMVSKTIPAGETFCEVTFTPNMDWTVSIPTDAETSRWFKLSDGVIESTSISGRASAEPVTIQVTTIDQESFDLSPVCEVSLTMGGQTQVIAQVTRGTAAREFNLYLSKYDTNENDFMPYEFEETPLAKYDGTEAPTTAPEGATELKWPVRVGEPMQVVKGSSNFNWLVSAPEWIEVSSPVAIDGESDSKQFFVTALFSKLTEAQLDGAVAMLDIYDSNIADVETPGANAHNRYCFTLPALRDVIRSNDQGAAFTFNGDGNYVDTNGTVMTATDCKIDITSAKGLEFFVITPDGYGGYYATGTEWTTITPESAWDDSEGAIQSKRYTIQVGAYAGNRSATILAMPQTVAATINKNDLEGALLDPNRSYDLKEEFKPYIFATIEQEGAAPTPADGFSLSYSEDFMTNYYIQSGYFNLEDLTEVDPNSDQDVYDNAGYIEAGAKLYRLTYGNESMSQGSLSLLLSGEYTSCTANPYTSSDWLMFMDMGDGTCMISMSGYGDAGQKGDKAKLVFYNGENIAAVVICIRNY